MIVKKLISNDCKQLFELIDIIEAHLENPDFWLPINEISKNHFFDNEWTEFYGMFDGEKLIGASALFYNTHEYGESIQQLNCKIDNVSEIGRAMVHPEYRGANVLYQINQELIKVAKVKKIQYLLATIHPQNIPSQKSFIKLGMKKQCTYIKNNKYLRDIFVMELCSTKSIL